MIDTDRELHIDLLKREIARFESLAKTLVGAEWRLASAKAANQKRFDLALLMRGVQ
jgi:hypothetical protein